MNDVNRGATLVPEHAFQCSMDYSVVDTIKNISAGKWPTFGQALRGSSPKSQKVGGSSRSAMPSKSTSSTRAGVELTPTNRMTSSQSD
ncbi:hypothetical protein FNV43_RR00451 [Rhamnella rubrinervis]|uniref:Uncharacterized protein n=1 Tax=Rhamnella rubrinervis TaxID=2594499 RepID=A0A8K0MRY0_9ROSA|nr:hypothetical protein FNV43_RR00451 [Rhamnella rubrinervis]